MHLRPPYRQVRAHAHTFAQRKRKFAVAAEAQVTPPRAGLKTPPLAGLVTPPRAGLKTPPLAGLVTPLLAALVVWLLPNRLRRFGGHRLMPSAGEHPPISRSGAMHQPINRSASQGIGWSADRLMLE